MRFNSELFSFENGSYASEASTLRITNGDMRQDVVLVKSKTGGRTTFRYVKTDWCSSHEDIMGWNYISDDGLRLLIIND